MLDTRSDGAVAGGGTVAARPGFDLLAPARLVALLVLVHVAVWTLAPASTHRGLPMDVMEGYVVGREWVIGYYKHPALPWWLLEASRLATGAVGWPAYLVAALLVAATYALVYVLGRDLVGAERAAAGTLLASGIIYFSWVTPELNHNVAQMPIWVGILLAMQRARWRGDARWWMLLGGLGGIGLYAKFSTGLLLVCCAAYILWDRRCRDQIRTAGPWLGLATFLVVAAPLAHWLLATKLQVLTYAEHRAMGPRAGSVPVFLAKQLAAGIGLYLLAIAAFGTALVWALAPARLRAAWAADRSVLAFLSWFHFAPLALAMAIATATGSGLKGAWGTPMLSLAGLLLVAWAPALVARASLARLAAGAAVLFALLPAAYAWTALRPGPVERPPSRIDWNPAEVAARFERIWHDRTGGAPLRIVGGDFWIGGMIATAGTARPQLLVEGDLARSPWLTAADIERHGALFVWWSVPDHPPLGMRQTAGARVDGTHLFRIPASNGMHEIWVPFAVRPPGVPVVAGRIPEWPQTPPETISQYPQK